MTRTQAWRKVAEAFDKPLVIRNSKERELTEDGLCWAIRVLEGRRYDIYDQMNALNDGAAYWWPRRTNSDGERQPNWTPKCDAERATFAGLMAAMTQRERNQLVEGL